MWTYQEVTNGHLAPLTRPDLIKPLIGAFLRSLITGDVH
jgi:hypothetical protein